MIGCQCIKPRRGHPGKPGHRGCRGPQGWQGDPGEDGAQGFMGDVGLDGPRGIQGVDGTQGIDAPVGLVGNSGPQGVSGLSITGAQGSKGGTGTASVIAGPLGLVGLPGFTGADGFGVQGAQGLPGSQGPPLTGSQGNLGNPGAQGNVGPQGIPGNIGPQGAFPADNQNPGPQGPLLVGQQGPQGYQGAVIAAPQGPQGIDGAGFQGVPGDQGPQGFDGSLVGPAGVMSQETWQPVNIIGYPNTDNTALTADASTETPYMINEFSTTIIPAGAYNIGAVFPNATFFVILDITIRITNASRVALVWSLNSTVDGQFAETRTTNDTGGVATALVQSARVQGIGHSAGNPSFFWGQVQTYVNGVLVNSVTYDVISINFMAMLISSD